MRTYLYTYSSSHRALLFAQVSDICFFLLAAETIVEVVDEHQGFRVVSDLLTMKSRVALFWAVGLITFFLSSILNNLTITVVMVSLMRKLLKDADERKLFGAMIVVASNAGGVWTPIGDVTTTMLWIGGELSTQHTITDLFFPSIVSLLVSLLVLQGSVAEVASEPCKDDLPRPPVQPGSTAALVLQSEVEPVAPSSQLILGIGLGSLLSVRPRGCESRLALSRARARALGDDAEAPRPPLTPPSFRARARAYTPGARLQRAHGSATVPRHARGALRALGRDRRAPRG